MYSFACEDFSRSRITWCISVNDPVSPEIKSHDGDNNDAPYNNIKYEFIHGSNSVPKVLFVEILSHFCSKIYMQLVQ